jgi:hypothetical protein
LHSNTDYFPETSVVSAMRRGKYFTRTQKRWRRDNKKSEISTWALKRETSGITHTKEQNTSL